MITHPLDGNDLDGGVAAEVVAEFGDVHVEVAGVEERVVAPNAEQDVFPGDGKVPVFDQDGQQLGFAGAQFARRAAGTEAEFVFLGVKGKFSHVDRFVGIAGGSRFAPGEGNEVLHPHDQFFHAEGFAHVVVAAGGKAPEHVFGLVFGAEEKNGEAGVVAPDGFGQGEPVAVGEHHIEYANVGFEALQCRQYAGAVGHHEYVKGTAFQAFLDDFAQKGFVFYVEDFCQGAGYGESCRRRLPAVAMRLFHRLRRVCGRKPRRRYRLFGETSCCRRRCL